MAFVQNLATQSWVYREYTHSAVTVHTSASISGYQEQTVTLPCHLSISDPNVKVVSITWKDPNHSNIAVYHPEHGVSYPGEENSSRIYFQNPSVEDATLVIRNFSRNDTGTYECSWTTYPDGSFSSKTVLKLADSTPVIFRTFVILAVICLLLLLGLLLLAYEAANWMSHHYQVAGRNSTRTDLDECPSEIVYTSVNIQQQNVRTPKKYCREDNVDSEDTVYSVLKHK
ncbi:T-cell immunoreceptor with Ig and ITIM domains-like [Rhincodon typus]|uniref:T-cell immunoreceptor with Ig and ITIM domains-like n=1 Tax=Rhincodon typus TaxID=259920 RepID=UPI00202E79CE|nr:T-cell immunoreceptor with Ig and ITIM domains-like [Rhincodon typus]